MADSIFHAFLPGLAPLPPQKRKRGRPRKRIYSLLGEGFARNHVARKLRGGQRKRVGDEVVYTEANLAELRGMIQKFQETHLRKNGKRVSERVALIGDIAEHYSGIREAELEELRAWIASRQDRYGKALVRKDQEELFHKKAELRSKQAKWDKAVLVAKAWAPHLLVALSRSRRNK